MTVFRPDTIDGLTAIIRDAAARQTALLLQGGGTKANMGAPTEGADILEMAGFTGVIDYDPAELVLTVGAGTPLADIEELVGGHRQMLAFDPFDIGPLFGVPKGRSTIGGVVASGLAGSRRLTAGGVRDHLLGFAAVSGRGEAFVGGAKVVKNVTGYDLPKLMAGSWGRLAALTEVTLKILPAPRTCATYGVYDLGHETACRAMAMVLGSQVGAAAAAHFPAKITNARAITAFRLEGFEPSVAARSHQLAGLLRDEGGAVPLAPEAGADLWNQLRTQAPLAGETSLWRINVPAKACPAVIDVIDGLGALWMVDWGGSLLWAGVNDADDLIRQAAAQAGGHAMLVRADPACRAQLPCLHPPAPKVAAMEARIRHAFDPAGVFETGRFGKRPHAD